MHERLPYLAFVGCSVIWGSTFLAIAYGNDEVDPIWAATIRLTIAAALLALITRASGASFPRGRQLRAAALFGLFNFGINFALLYSGEKHVPSGIAAVFYATIPLSAALFAALLGVERLDLFKAATATVALAGVVLIFAGQLGAGAPPAALAAVFVAATSTSLSAVFLKQAPGGNVFAVNSIGCAIGAVFCFVASTIAGERQVLPATFAAWWPIAYLTLAGSLGAFVLYAWLIKRWSVVTTSFISLLVVVIALVLGAVFRAERPTTAALVGAAVVIGAVFVTLRRSQLRSRAAGAAAPA